MRAVLIEGDLHIDDLGKLLRVQYHVPNDYDLAAFRLFISPISAADLR